MVGGKFEFEFEFEYEKRKTQPRIGFHRARAQPALAGGTRARTRFALEARAWVNSASEVASPERRRLSGTPQLLSHRRCFRKTATGKNLKLTQIPETIRIHTSLLR